MPYTHPSDSILTKMFQTMQFNATSGKPELRVSIVDGVTISGNVTIPGTVTIASGGTIGITNFPATQAVSGPLTDTQLRATPVPVSGSVSLAGTITASLGDVSTNSHDRLRVTDYETVWFNTFQFSKEVDQWDEAAVSGGTASWNLANSGVDLTTNTTSTSSIIRQTQRVALYTPGRPAQLNQQILFATPKANMTQRVGLFDTNNGFYFETVGTSTLNCVIRSNTSGSVVNTVVARANWNGDKLDGAGKSGLTLDLTKQQLLHFDYEWYGVGSVQFGFIMNDQIVNFHTFYAANLINSVWCATPFLPIRLELFNTGSTTASTLRQGSNSILVDGLPGTTDGTSNSFYSPIGGSAVAQNVFIPVLGIRLKSTTLNAVCRPTAMEAGGYITTGGDTGATSGAVAYQVIKNPTLTGASWTDHPNTSSFMQTDVASTAYTGGTIVASGFMLSGSQRIDFSDDIHFQLGRTSMGTVSDTFVIAIAGVGGARTAYASLQWTEAR